MKLVSVSPDVYRAIGPMSVLGDAEMALLRNAVSSSKRGRVRINLHQDNDDPVHEMFIAIRADSYVRPHRHIDKSESFHVVEGEVDVIIFDENGVISDVVSLGGLGSARYYRLCAPRYHTIVIHTPVLIVHETTCGPFDPNDADFASFAPIEGADPMEIHFWQMELLRRLEERRTKR